MFDMISACILTKNSAETLPKTLDSLKDLDEVIIMDNGSEDNTLEIAQKYPNVKIFEHPFIGFGPLRNLAALKAQNEWILAIDSDEVLDSNFYQEIKNTNLDPTFGYVFSRHNFFNGKKIHGCGWSNDFVARLYHRRIHSYSEDLVHESLISKKNRHLKSILIHTPYQNTSDFLKKMQHYSTLFAKQNEFKKKGSFFKAFTHGSFAFIKSYFLKLGIFDGKEGFFISFYNSSTAFFKYIKLYELQKKIETTK